MRHFIDIITERASPLTKTIEQQAAEVAIRLIDWGSGYGEQLVDEYKRDKDIDDEDDNTIKVDTSSLEFIAWLDDFFLYRVEGAYSEIEWLFKNNSLRCWRVITASRDWTPTNHIGVYWSWDEDASEAHWGSFSSDQVKWRIEALIPDASIDWPYTLGHNASTCYESEKEIRIYPNAHYDIVSVTQV